MNNIITMTLPAKPQPQKNIGLMFAPLLMEIVGNKILSQKMIKQDNRYLIDTQYLLFNDEITERLVNIIEDPKTNIASEINKIIHDPELLKAGVTKDWDYKELH